MIDNNYLLCFYHIFITGCDEQVGRMRHLVIETVIKMNYLSCFYYILSQEVLSQEAISPEQHQSCNHHSTDNKWPLPVCLLSAVATTQGAVPTGVVCSSRPVRAWIHTFDAVQRQCRSHVRGAIVLVGAAVLFCSAVRSHRNTFLR